MTRLSSDNVPPLHRVRQDIKKRFSDVVSKGMELDFRKRYQSMEEMLKDLEKAESENAFGSRAADTSGSSENGIFSYDAPQSDVKSVSLWEKVKSFFRSVFSIKAAEEGKLFAQMIKGPLEGWLFEFSSNGILSFGRSGQYSNAVIEDKSLSRLHCTIWFNEKDRRLYIQDFSSNGTFKQNGERLQKEIMYPLDFGEIFYLASTEYTAQVINIKQGE